MKISYAILTHNEGEEIDRLLNFLVSNKRKEDEIVIVDDNSTDDKTIEVLEKFRSEIVLKTRNFDGDATQKNFLNSHCTGDYILQLDADEIMTADFIKMLPEILKTNETVPSFLESAVGVCIKPTCPNELYDDPNFS